MDQQDVRPIGWSIVRRLAGYALRYKYRIMLAIVVLMMAVGIEMIGPLITRTVIDKHLIHAGTDQFEYAPILRLVALYFGVLFTAGLFNYLQAYLLQTTALRIVFNIRMELMRRLQRIPMRFFDNTPIGRLVNRIANDTESIRDLYMSFMATFSVSIVQVTTIFVMLFLLAPKFARVVLFILPLCALIMFLLMKFGNRYLSIMRARISDINTMLSESIMVMPVLQLFRREQVTIREFEALNEEWRVNHYKQLRLSSLISRNLISLAIALFTAWIVWTFGSQSLQGAVSIGVMTALIDYVGRLFYPIIGVFDQLVNAQRAFISADRVFELLDEPAEEQAEPAKNKTAVAREQWARAQDEAAASMREEGNWTSRGRRKLGEVRFENVWFAYNNEDYVLKEISFEAKPGETIAFVGHTGSGKSSIMNLLLGFYEAQRGTIAVDGRDIRNMSKQELRSDMAVVLQDPFLFAGDIKFNVSMYNEEITPERVRQALEEVGADTFVNRLPLGMDEPVVERGSTMSAGQRQLITFARALAHDPAILILDEATASIDSETEGLIQHGLQVLSRGRTTFIIAHRLSTIRDADLILVLHKGEIVERGTHDELIRLGGRYHRMYELQKGGTLVS